MDVMPAVCAALDPSAMARGLVRPQRSAGVVRLGQLIKEALAEFDPQTPASFARRKPLRPVFAHVSLPRDWIKQAV